MMERLKGGKPSETPANGELVTRADGTQAIRVRKRKRRSEQPKREELKRLKRTRAMQIGGVLASLIVLTLIIGGAFVYTNTAPYRKRLSDAISQHLGANAEFKMFRVTPVSANADAVTLNWQNGGFLKEVKLRGVTARLSPLSLFGRALTGDELMAREGEIILQTPAPAKSAASDNPDGVTAVSFDRAVISKLNLCFGDPAAAAFMITGTEASLSVVENKSWQSLNLHRGSLPLHGWPPLRIDRALMDIQPAGTDIIGLRLMDSLSPRGDLDLAGSINTLTPEARSTLSVKLRTFNLADLLGPEIGTLINLRLDTRDVPDSNYLAFPAANPAEAELAIAFTNSLSSSNSLTGLRFLAFLARSLDDSYYEKPEFDEATGMIRRKADVIEFSELHLERKNNICVKGNFSVAADKTLSGTLEIGLPDTVIGLSENPKLEAIFSPESNNFRWVKVKLSGTLARPADDFAETYDAAAADSPAPDPDAPVTPEPPKSPDTPEANPAKPADPGKAFDELTIPP